VEGKKVCVIGAWDGTECLLLYALGAKTVDAVDEVLAFTEMAQAQYDAWKIPGHVYSPRSLYEIDVESWWQTYDLVYVPGVLYHLTDLPTALVLLWSILKPGGVLAFESLADEPGANTARYLGPSVPGWNWWAPTANCYEALLRDCGFPDGRTVEFTGGRGWWTGTRSQQLPALANGSAGFSRPDVLRTIARLSGRS
jgi:SAM-dependent methyltransferase